MRGSIPYWACVSLFGENFRVRCDSYESRRTLLWTIYFPTAPLHTVSVKVRSSYALAVLCNIVDQLLGCLPAEARIGNRFPVDMVADLLAAGL